MLTQCCTGLHLAEDRAQQRVAVAVHWGNRGGVQVATALCGDVSPPAAMPFKLLPHTEWPMLCPQKWHCAVHGGALAHVHGSGKTVCTQQPPSDALMPGLGTPLLHPSSLFLLMVHAGPFDGTLGRRKHLMCELQRPPQKRYMPAGLHSEVG